MLLADPVCPVSGLPRLPDSRAQIAPAGVKGNVRQSRCATKPSRRLYPRSGDHYVSRQQRVAC